MTKGEAARAKLAPNYGFGEQGNATYVSSTVPNFVLVDILLFTGRTGGHDTAR